MCSKIKKTFMKKSWHFTKNIKSLVCNLAFFRKDLFLQKGLGVIKFGSFGGSEITTYRV